VIKLHWYTVVGIILLYGSAFSATYIVTAGLNSNLNFLIGCGLATGIILVRRGYKKEANQ